MLTAAWVAFSVQIRMEEEHLEHMHGTAYDRYRATVPSWIVLPDGSGRASASEGHPVDHG
ncbi:hypothetical protein JKG68_17550 [Microvirga aerilata]|uniref:Isoprenylcysteine carboxylmethyltransferase family protein n=1 Tax=Microvirga aerilata TaxID=670292 RepID=A0A936Z7Y3_9HYPH|nr:hypothetical protein [Microvirga aerilata]MBL0405768.1 hypothetical protein [Microvirga aerilata]